MSALPPITVTTLDAARLGALICTRVGTAYRQEARRLRDELRRAIVLPSEEIPHTVVTMNSRVVFAELETRQSREITLVYPWNARDRGALSILSPVGTALLGLQVGDAIRWPVGEVDVHTFRVLALPYQPEASGHFHL